ncbi:hypothetical protein AYI70_g3416 [Smittium culicis]|uniref:Uncharacterized protein n=1 Tax=Smittium culicis TaxID=133412 RepID=A0A1R1Y3N3_9FUNG|nr:hypothetical protein AYI70_g3416 [Smittium culicis]
MSKQNNDKKYGYHHKEPARNSTVFLPHIDGKNYEDTQPEAPVASSSRNPIPASATPPPRYAAHKRPAPLINSGSESSVTLTDSSSPSPSPPEPAVSEAPVASSSRNPIPASATPPPRYAAHKRPAPLINSGSESSVTLTDSSSPSSSPPEPAVVTPPFTGFKRPATPTRFAAQKREAQSSSPFPLPPSTSSLPSCCRPSSSIRRTTSGSVPSPFRIPKYSPLNPGPIRFNPPDSAPLQFSRTQSSHNLTAALSCSTFTPYEYSRKVKALEQLTGKRDTSVNPYHLVIVTGINPQPIRSVKQCLIGLSICVANVANIKFNGRNTELLVLKTYLSTFIYKISNNPNITIIHF